MADKNISSLPAATTINDNALFVAEQNGEAVKVSGKQFIDFAQSSVEGYIDQAQQAANDALEAVSKIGTAVEDTQANKTAAQAAQEGAENAKAAIENMTVDANTLPSGSQASVSKSILDGIVNLTFRLPTGTKGDKGEKGEDGNSIESIQRTSGTGAPGSIDTYTVTLTDGSTSTFNVYNGRDGTGSGDMSKSVYDTNGKNTDIFNYVDNAIQDIPGVDIDTPISNHNLNESAHPHILSLLDNKEESGAASSVQSNLDSHIQNKNNPHAVTAEQVGAIPTVQGQAGQFLGFSENNVISAIDLPASTSSGKRVSRVSIGTSTAGWTEDDVDYLCNGTNDSDVINQAIQDLSPNGGEIIILDGTYEINSPIELNINFVTITGNGDSTVLKRMWNSSVYEGVVNINMPTRQNTYCHISNLKINGNKQSYSSNYCAGILLMNAYYNSITKCNISDSNIGIFVAKSNSNEIQNNTCTNSISHGIFVVGDLNIVYGNRVYKSDTNGISLATYDNKFSSYNIISGNLCSNNKENGIVLIGCYGSTINNNIAQNNKIGIYCSSMGESNISCNMCYYNTTSGISINASVGGSLFVGNVCHDTGITGLTAADNGFANIPE